MALIVAAVARLAVAANRVADNLVRLFNFNNDCKGIVVHGRAIGALSVVPVTRNLNGARAAWIKITRRSSGAFMFRSHKWGIVTVLLCPSATILTISCSRGLSSWPTQSVP